MIMVPYEKTKLSSKSDNFKVISEFLDGDYDCVELVDYPQKCANYCQTSLNASIKKYRFVGVKVMVRGEHVYLVKKEI